METRQPKTAVKEFSSLVCYDHTLSGFVIFHKLCHDCYGQQRLKVWSDWNVALCNINLNWREQRRTVLTDLILHVCWSSGSTSCHRASFISRSCEIKPRQENQLSQLPVRLDSAGFRGSWSGSSHGCQLQSRWRMFAWFTDAYRGRLWLRR